MEIKPKTFWQILSKLNGVEKVTNMGDESKPYAKLNGIDIFIKVDADESEFYNYLQRTQTLA